MLKKKYAVILIIIIAVMITGISLIVYKNNKSTPTSKEVKAMEKLSDKDRELAGVYAKLYDESKDRVAELKVELEDWDKVNEKLDSEYFTIGENEKTIMVKDGYLLTDLYEAENLARKTGRKAIDLAKAKGKESDRKEWSDVVKDEEILTTEEQLGLTKKQVKQLKKHKLDKDERMEVAILCLNKTYTFDEIIKQLNKGKNLEEIKEKK